MHRNRDTNTEPTSRERMILDFAFGSMRENVQTESTLDNIKKDNHGLRNSLVPYIVLLLRL